MNVLLHPAVGVLLTALLPWTTVPQSLVPIQFQISPVQVATGSNAVFTLQTTKDIFSISWVTPNGITLGQWIGSQAELNSVPQYQGRITITATQLTISACKLSDAGNYTVTVIPTAVTGLLTNTRSVPLNVFDAVTQVSLTVPTVAIEGSNATLLCTWATGSNTTVTWSKSNSGLSSDATVNGGSLVLNPASRNDAGIYSCTVSNPVSAQTATATLTVYYGPDTPQVSKTSSGCVGGGDVTVGQTIQLTCTSASMPPALLSWQYGGKPLTTSQPSGGTLSLQVFSTNQSGQYTCMASNSITGGVSQQQLTVTVVGTCLSAGAVAGIVIGCFIALVLIIIAIVLLLRQRNVDRRLRDVIGVQKTNLNNEPPVRPASHNTLVTSGMRGNGNTHNLPIDGQTSAAVWHTGQGNGEMVRQDGQRALGHNGQLNTGTFPNNDHISAALSHNTHQNSNSYPHNGPHNSSSIPQLSRENPEILIQTGRAEAGTHTVLINLNSLNDGQQHSSAAQPHTVQVNLTTPHQSPGQPNQSAGQHNQQSSALQQAYPNVRTRTGDVSGAPQSAFHRGLGNRAQEPSSLVQTDRSYPTNQGLAGRITDPVYPQSVPRHRRQNRRRSRSPEPPAASGTHLHQMPWDRLRETPAYPSAYVDESDSSGYQSPTSRSDAPGTRIPQTQRWTSPEDRRRQAASQAQSGQLQRREAEIRSRVDPTAQRQGQQTMVNIPRPTAQGTQPKVNSQVPAVRQNPTNPEQPRNTTVPQNHTTQTRATQPTHVIAQTRPEERRAIPNPLNTAHPLPLTQTALQRHVTQTPNPFPSRIHQTQAALKAPQPNHTHALPTTQLNRHGTRPPTPPAVLRPAEFQTLPRKPLEQAHAEQPARRPDVHKHTRTHQHSSPHRHTGHHHAHTSRNPAHTNQIQKSRARL